jgi:hypothetical protein
MKDEKNQIRCTCENKKSKEQNGIKPDASMQMFLSKPITGKQINSKFKELLFNFDTTKIYVTVVIHTVSINGIPVVNQNYINTMLSTANAIWSQACITIVPYYTGEFITEFWDLGIQPFIGCNISPENEEVVMTYEITTPVIKIANLFLVRETNGIACGDPFDGRIFMPTINQSAEKMGGVLAHELGHLFLNPLGIDDSENPNHLMYHPSLNSEPQSDINGLYLSECVGARELVKQEYFYSGKQEYCKMSPRLGNNLAIVSLLAKK